MNSRERIEIALHFKQPDRTPIFASFVPEIEYQLRSELDISEMDAGAALGDDMVKSCIGGLCVQQVMPYGTVSTDAASN